MKLYSDDRVTVSRGDLSATNVLILDRVLIHHGLPKSSPHQVPEKLAYACLNCGSIGECESREARDTFVEHYDVQCCGLTVVFRSTDKVLVDPSKLTIVPEPQVSEPIPSYELIGKGGMARCKRCGSTDWVSNFNHQGCTVCRDREDGC